MIGKKINQLATELSPATDDLTIIGDPVTGVSKKITLLQIANLFATTGTVSSVAVTETGNALTITGSPITSAGTINIGFAGLASQYVRGDGTLGDFPGGGGGGGASVAYYLNGSVNQGTFGGTTYYEMNKNPIIGAGTDFTINTNGYIASFLTDAGDPALLNIPGGNWNLELYFSASSSGGSPSFYVELYKYDGTTFTLLASNSASPEGITNGTTIDLYFTAISVPTTTLAITDRLAIRVYVNNSGRTITLHTENSHLCEVITTFSTGLTALNGLTAQVQYLTTGTSGTDFNIASATATHTFNLPTASATNRGALSSADWTTFNSKQNALTNPITGTGTSGQVAYFNGTNSITSNAAFAFTPTSQLLVNNSVTAASAIARGTNLTPTLTAAANNDVLVGLDINPTFTNGAFTGVANVGLFIRRGVLNVVNGWAGTPNQGDIGYFGNPVGGAAQYIAIDAQSGFASGIIFRGQTTGRWTQYRDGATNNLYFLSSATAGNINFALFHTTNNVGINTSTDAGFRLDVNGTARVQGVITGSVGSGTLILGAAAANNQAITITGFFTSAGAISTSNGNQRGYAARINVQDAGAFWASGISNGQNLSTTNAFFRGTGAINYADAAVGSNFNGVLFDPTITAQVNTVIYAFRSTLTAATDRWNLFMSGSANNYLEGDLGIGTSTFGTATKFTLGGSETASSAIARGQLLNTTLVAAANNDVLVGLDINPTFTNGAFTGVQNYAARINGLVGGITAYMTTGTGATSHYLELVSTSSTNGYVNFRRNGGPNGTTAYQLNGGNGYFSVNAGSGETTFGSSSGGYFTNLYSGGTEGLRIFGATRNVVIQNGGTFTDAGFRLDVNGTARVGSVFNTTSTYINLGNTSFGSTNDGINYNTSGVGFLFAATAAATTTPIFTLYTGTNTATSGTTNWLNFRNGSTYTFAPTSGTGVFNAINLAPIIFQTGGANGITRGLYINSTLTAAADYRAIETTTGNVLFATTSGSIGIGASTINASAKVQIDSTNSGFLPPRMTTTQKNAISSPATGLVIYDTVDNELDYYNGTSWQGLLTLGTQQTVTGFKQFSASRTASLGVAQGTLMTPTLTASANNDVLVGLDISPTYSNGAFTGVTNTALRVIGNTNITGTLAIGNTVTSASSVSSTHKVSIIIGGVQYYLLASNV